MKSIAKKHVADVVELANKKWVVVKEYQNPRSYYPERIVMINPETGQKLDCANSLV